MILKEDKDSSQCAHYRPISLLNVDLNILTKIMAYRLVNFTPDLVSLDKLGFMAIREAKDNVIKALNLIHLASNLDTPSLFLSTDTEKAFDKV